MHAAEFDEINAGAQINAEKYFIITISNSGHTLLT